MNGESAESSTAAIASSTAKGWPWMTYPGVSHLRGYLSQMTLEARTRRRVLSLALTNWPTGGVQHGKREADIGTKV